MKLNTQDSQQLRSMVDRMKADRVPPQMVEQAINVYMQRKQNQYQAIAQAKADEQKRLADIAAKKAADEKAEEERAKAEAAAAEKERVSKLNKNSDFEFGQVITQANKDEDEIIAQYTKKYAHLNIGVETTGTFGDTVIFKIPGMPPTTVNLDGSEKAQGQLAMLELKLNSMDKEFEKTGPGYNLLANADTRGKGLLGVLTGFDRDDLQRANKGYEAIGMEIIPAGAKGYGYIIKKNGEEIWKGRNADAVNEYLFNRDNFTVEEKEKLEAAGIEAIKRQQEAYEKIQKDRGYTIDKTISENNYKNSDQANRDAEILFEGISEDGLKNINTYLNFDDGTDNPKANRFDNLFSDEVRSMLSEEDQEVFQKALLKKDEKDDDGKTLIERSIERQYNADNEAVWNAEYAEQLREGDDKLLVAYGTKVKAKDLIGEEKQINDNLDAIQEKYKSDSNAVIQDVRGVLRQANADGVTVEQVEDKYGKIMYKASGDQAGKYQPLLNKFVERKNLLDQNYKRSINVESDRYKNWFTNNQENSKIGDFARRESDLDNIMADQFLDAAASIGGSIPILFGSKTAIANHKSRQAGADAYEAALDYKTAVATGQKGRYSLITLSQQAPNVMLAMAGTGGASGVFKASQTVAAAITASSFGINSGTSKYADLTIQRAAAIEADERLEELEKNKNLMTYEDYINQKASLSEQAALKDMTPGQIRGQAFVTGLIEGGVAFTLGTIPNASKLLKGVIQGPGDDILNAITQKNLQYYGGAFLEAF